MREYSYVVESSTDITSWIEWFLLSLKNAIESSEKLVKKIMAKHAFWNENKTIPFNDRQIKIIDMLLVEFFGNLTTSKWAKINKCSPDTALRDIQDLIKKGVFKKQAGGGRSTSYELIFPDN